MRYFFHLAHGRGIAVDHEGDELHDDGAAIDPAGSIGREMVDYRHYYWPTINRSAFIVTDKSGRHVATVPVSPGSDWDGPRKAKLIMRHLGAVRGVCRP